MTTPPLSSTQKSGPVHRGGKMSLRNSLCPLPLPLIFYGATEPGTFFFFFTLCLVAADIRVLLIRPPLSRSLSVCLCSSGGGVFRVFFLHYKACHLGSVKEVENRRAPTAVSVLVLLFISGRHGSAGGRSPAHLPRP